MTRIESPKNLEAFPTAKEIDAWVFSRYKLNALIYFRLFENYTDAELFEVSLPKGIAIDTKSYNRILNQVEERYKLNPENSDIEKWYNDIKSGGKEKLLELLPAYPGLLRMVNEELKIESNFEENVLNIRSLCELVGNKFFQKYPKDIITDKDGIRAVLLVSETGESKDRFILYSPLQSLLPPLSPPERVDTDPEESYKREKEYRQNQDEMDFEDDKEITT